MSLSRWCALGAAVQRALSLVPSARSVPASPYTRSAPAAAARTMYVAEERGSAYAPDYRVYFSEYSLRSTIHYTAVRSRRGAGADVCRMYRAAALGISRTPHSDILRLPSDP